MPVVSGFSSADQAIARAKTVSAWTKGMCDQFVAQMYGYQSSGYATALTNWNATPANLKHPGDMQAPPGALMYWGGGAGHVALSLGNGSIVSTDIGGDGTVSTVPATAITQKWGKSYLGWTYPYFQGKEAANSLGPYTGTTSVANATQAGLTVSSDSLASGFIGEILKPFEVLMNSIIWGVETLAGLALIGLGTYVMVRHQ